jgi:hypothetical protein
MSIWVELWVRLKVVDLVAQTAWMTLTEKLDFADRIHGLLRYSFWGFTAEGSDGPSIIEELDRVVRLDGAFTNQNKHQYRLMALGGVTGRGVPLEGLSADGIPVNGVTGRGVPLEGVSGDGVGAGGGDRAGVAGGTPPPELHRGDLALDQDFAVTNPPSGEGAAGLRVFDCLIRERNGDREVGFTDRLNGRVRNVRVSRMKAGEVWRIIVSAGSVEEALRSIERIAVTRSRREGLLFNPHYQTCELVSLFSHPAVPARGGGE